MRREWQKARVVNNRRLCVTAPVENAAECSREVRQAQYSARVKFAVNNNMFISHGRLYNELFVAGRHRVYVREK